MPKISKRKALMISKIIIYGMIIRIYPSPERMELKKCHETFKEQLVINSFLTGNMVKY